ncbi:MULTISPECIES: N-formylglutamate amidohydrolase [unclassified Streptomyces]|uniref:N-formylglutamate amidohydrolase n=1 Tax=unclassified Streptomyces TaxID=2593676 RepID=UPI0034DAD4A6
MDDTLDSAASPDSFELLPGAVHSPVILHVPHSAREIPTPVRAGIVLGDAALEGELDHITDAHTDELAAAVAEGAGLTPWRFVNRLSRLVVDPERFPDDREEMLAAGMGAVYTRTTHRAPLRPADSDPGPLVDRYFHPYAQAMTDAVAGRLAATGRAVVVDIHSYPTARLPYELHGDGPRPAVCLGTDSFHTPPELVALAEKAFAGLGGVGIDSPFSGAYVPLRYYEREPAVTALMVEIRRDTYMTEPGGRLRPGFARLVAALTMLVDTAGG